MSIIIIEEYFECEDCGHHQLTEYFVSGYLWWEKLRCPKCKSENIVDYRPKKSGPPPPSPHAISKYQRMEDKRILEFIYDRMQNFHLENPRYDYMIKLKQLIDRK